MKYIMLLMTLLAGVRVVAQNDKSVTMPDPEYLNLLYYYSASANSLAALEKKEAEMKNKLKFGGLGGASSSYVIKGDKSSLRIKNNEPAQFAVKMQSMMMDPSQMIILYRFEPKGGNRHALIQGSGQPGGGIRYLVKKTPTGTFILVPEVPLPPGEYGFLNMMMPTSNGRAGMSYSVFAFGIDN